MWRLSYLLLLAIRLRLALYPSYLHPDEHSQGPEVIAGRVFGYPVDLTWEFTSEHPVRSTLPLWLCYGVPMWLLKTFGRFLGFEVLPSMVFWTLRVMMFALSVVLVDGAVFRLVSNHRRRTVLLLVASSYVSWSFQMHTFSNSFETLGLLWVMVLGKRILTGRSHLVNSALIGFIGVVGTFNRITFPAFLGVPALYLVPQYLKRPLPLGILIISAIFTTGLAVALDTRFYRPETRTFEDTLYSLVITPLNNFLYNSSKDNLAQHGLHPFYQHALVNLPQLLGPALLLVRWDSFLIAPALFGALLLSLFPHQEARFLLPAVPLLLTSVHLPSQPLRRRVWLAIWIIFNTLGGLLMGVYHQGGIVPAQLWISGHLPNHATIHWWKTYSPPAWLGPGVEKGVNTVVLKGMRAQAMMDLVDDAICGANTSSRGNIYLVAPSSSTFLDQFHDASAVGNGLTAGSRREPPLKLESLWTYRHHINLDDLDFGDDGVMPTLHRVIGRRGITVWKVERLVPCSTP